VIIKNEIRNIAFALSSSNLFQLPDTAVTVGVRSPDGVYEAYTSLTSPSVNVTPGAVDSKTQTIDITLNFNQAGIWRVEWAAVIGSETKLYEEIYFVATSNIWDFIRNTVLGISSQKLSDSQIDPVLAALNLTMLNEFSCIGPYDDLTWPDTLHFDNALAYLAGAAIYRANPQNYPAGPLIQITQGPVTYKYSDPRRRGMQSDIYGEAWNEINQISCVMAAQADFISTAHLYALYGRGRAIKENRNITPNSNILLQITDPFSISGFIAGQGWYNGSVI
jgi:hypothetical protein